MTLAVIVFAAAAAGIGYALYFSERALPGVSVLGESVKGMKRSEVEELIQTRVDATDVQVTLEDSTTQVPLDELGYTIDVSDMVDQAFASNASIPDRFRALTQEVQVDSDVNFDPEILAQYTESLATQVGAAATNASVSLDPETETFVVTPGSSGAKLDEGELASVAEEAARTLSPAAVSLDVATVDPVVDTASAEKVAKAANRVLDSPVELTTTLNIYSPERSEVATWVILPAVFTGETVEGGVDQTLETEISIDEEKATQWVEGTTLASNDDPVPGLRNINSRGDVVQVVSEGEPGWTANNTQELVDGLLAALPAGEGFVQQIDYDEVEPTEWEEQLIADGAEDLAYQATDGERWIDINLSNFTTTAYEGATVVRGPVSMVPGAPGLETVTGKYKVWAKVASQTMRGDNLDGTKYETPDVPWILYFHSGYALHGAYWRDSFGYGGAAGSHGCVNMPVEEAKWFYDWASVGTPVVSHY